MFWILATRRHIQFPGSDSFRSPPPPKSKNQCPLFPDSVAEDVRADHQFLPPIGQSNGPPVEVGFPQGRERSAVT